MSDAPRRVIVLSDETAADGAGRPLAVPVRRAAAAAVLANPFAGRHGDDLTALMDLAEVVGARLAAEALAALGAPAVAYGKAALVGADGLREHGAALIHPRLGRPMREAVGGGAALIPSTCKVGAMGAVLDVPLGAIEDAWSFDHLDTLPICVPDAPRPGEILLVVAYAAGSRLHARVGAGPTPA